MSFSQLALRLAAIEGLRPYASLSANGPLPTLAGRYVFDTRLDPIEDLSENEARPVVVVYTDDDEGVSAQKRGGPPFLFTIDLCFECSVVVRAPGESGGFIVGQPETDPELEASLNMLGAQIAFALLYAPCGRIFQNVSKRRVHAPKSEAHRSAEEAVRLARRVITWKVEVESDMYDPAPEKFARDIAALPEPLRSVARALPEGSSGRALIDGLIAAPTLPRMPRRVPLQTIGFQASIRNK